jgi:hypothetical protein
MKKKSTFKRSFIEEFNVYYGEDDRNKVQSFQKCFFDDKFPGDLLNFSIPGGGKHGYVLEIPKGTDYPFAKPVLSLINHHFT